MLLRKKSTSINKDNPLCGWSAIATRIALTCIVTIIVVITAQQRAVLISSAPPSAC